MAQREEIGHPAQEEGDDRINPHLAAAPHQSPEEEGGGGQRPEEQVQKHPQPPGQAPPQQPQQVVHHPQGKPQAHPPQEGEGLVDQINLHQWKRREKKPPPLWTVSS